MLVRKSSPLKLERSAPAASRKVKLPSLMVTRRTSGATANRGSDLGGLLGAICATGEAWLGFVRTTGDTLAWTESCCCCCGDCGGGDTRGSGCAETTGDCACDEPGNRHFPSAFCGQTTFGLTRDTSLITSLREKRDRNRTLNRNVFASRKCFGPAAELCGIVMPLSSNPPHGVTLMLRICSVVPIARLNSC